MLHAELDQPVVVTYRTEGTSEPIKFDSLRKALHTIILDFEPERLPSAFICTKQGGLNIVEIRALYDALCAAYADSMAKQGAFPGLGRFPLDA